MCRGRIDYLEVIEKHREFQEMAKNADRFSELLESVCTTESDAEREIADSIVEGWEQLVKNTASKVLGKLMICNRAVK